MKNVLKNLFKKRRVSVFAIISFVFLFAYAVSLIVPLLWALMTSFKDYYNDFLDNGGFGWPKQFMFSNYATIFSKFVAPMETEAGDVDVGLGIMILNSAWYALGTSIVSTMASFLVGYVVARFKFKFCGVIYTVVILQMIIPTVGTLPSELRIAQTLRLYNTVYGMLFMKSYVTGLYFLSFYAALRVIPKDYTEAAYLDGAGNFRVMFNIMLPMSSGIFSTVLLLNFIAFWNDYQTPLIYMPSFPTLAFGLWHYIKGAYDLETSNPPMQLGGCMLMAVPLLVIFCIFQKKLLGNVSLGGLK
ncbi:MAG: carbohydrate ABC transporter permease [Clostridia bacterium]|nr:carbohydrate ABC transporter permease [Clostridia bacterium]